MQKFLFLALLLSVPALSATQSFNEEFLGQWEGTAPTKNLCSGAKNKISLKIARPETKSAENYKVLLTADWSCFAEMAIPGFIFGDEFWGASDDRMTFVKLKLSNTKTLSGEFRFDLNGHTLKMDFKDLRRAGPKLKLGVFSLVTESDWGAAFELKKNGVLIVTPWFTSGEGLEPERKKTIQGTWKETGDGIEATYGGFKDLLKLEARCSDWKDYYCFRYAKSMAKAKEKSPLNEDYPFINWSWKNTNPASALSNCKEHCTELARKGELKKGLDINSCAKELCK